MHKLLENYKWNEEPDFINLEHIKKYFNVLYIKIYRRKCHEHKFMLHIVFSSKIMPPLMNIFIMSLIII